MCDKCKEDLNNEQEQIRESKRLPNGLFKCENPDCSNEHDGSYGSGRFCSKKCVFEYIASINRGANNPLVKSHLDNASLAFCLSLVLV